MMVIMFDSFVYFYHMRFGREKVSTHLHTFNHSLYFSFKLLVVWFLRNAWHCFFSDGPHFLLENYFLSRGSHSF